MGMLDSVVSKIPFTSGILGFGEFCFCSFVAHLKTIPFPFKSTRGRYDPCFGPAAPPPTPPPLPSLRPDHPKIQCLPFVGERWERTLFKLFLRATVRQGIFISTALLISHQFPVPDAVLPFRRLGTQAHSSETMGLRLLGFPVVASDLISSSPTHSFGHLSLGFNRLPLFLTGL